MREPRQRYLSRGQFHIGSLALVLLAACTSSRRLRSSLYLPCPPKAIAISDETSVPGQDTWLASCRGRDYGCSATAVGNKVVYACRPLRGQADAGVPDGGIPGQADAGAPDGGIPGQADAGAPDGG